MSAPLKITDRPASFEQPVVIDSKGKMNNHHVIIYKNPSLPKDIGSCCNAILKKFEEVGKHDLALPCFQGKPRSGQKQVPDAVNSDIAEEALTVAISYAYDHPDVNIGFIAKDKRTFDIYNQTLSKPELSDLYDADAWKRIHIEQGNIGSVQAEVLAFTEDDLPEIQNASREYVQHQQEEEKKAAWLASPKKREATLQEPVEVPKTWKDKLKDKKEAVFGKGKETQPKPPASTVAPKAAVQPKPGFTGADDINAEDL